jgi:hypothetical protein
MVNWKAFLRKRSWYYLSILLEGLRKATENLRTSGAPAEILSDVIQKTDPESNRYTNLLGAKTMIGRSGLWEIDLIIVY